MTAQSSVYENKILVQNCLQNELTLVSSFVGTYSWSDLSHGLFKQTHTLFSYTERSIFVIATYFEFMKKVCNLKR